MAHDVSPVKGILCQVFSLPLKYNRTSPDRTSDKREREKMKNWTIY
jgi:hypothetical protein